MEENKFIFKKYKTIKQIGGGAFGNIYSVIRLKDREVFAMKAVKKNNDVFSSLESEAYYLFNLQGGIGIPKFITYGHLKKYNVLIEELLDESLYDIYIKKNKNCSKMEVYKIGIQILDRLEYIHSKGILHRDIKPENFLRGLKDPNLIYIIDFGLCKKYRSSKTGKHILPKNIGTITGALKYASPNVIKLKESSRRDDLISLGYMLIYLFKKELPWEFNMKSINDLNRENYQKLINLKETDGNGNLFKKIPPELVEFVKYAKNLKFEQEPNYSYLRSIFYNIIFKRSLTQNHLASNFIGLSEYNTPISKRNISLYKSNIMKRIYNKIKENITKRTIMEKSYKSHDLNLKYDSPNNDFSFLQSVNNYSQRANFDNKLTDMINNENNTKEKTRNLKEKEKTNNISKKETNKIINLTTNNSNLNTKTNFNKQKTLNFNDRNNSVINNNTCQKRKNVEKKKTKNINNFNFIFNSNYLYNTNCTNCIDSNKNEEKIRYSDFKDKNSLFVDLYKNIPFSTDINYKSPLLNKSNLKNNSMNDYNNKKNYQNKVKNSKDINSRNNKKNYFINNN